MGDQDEERCGLCQSILLTIRYDYDPDFAKQWVVAMKNLFDIEDENNNKILERHEFDKFIMASTAAIMNPSRVASETT